MERGCGCGGDGRGDGGGGCVGWDEREGVEDECKKWAKNHARRC